MDSYSKRHFYHTISSATIYFSHRMTADTYLVKVIRLQPRSLWKSGHKKIVNQGNVPPEWMYIGTVITGHSHKKVLATLVHLCGCQSVLRIYENNPQEQINCQFIKKLKIPFLAGFTLTKRVSGYCKCTFHTRIVDPCYEMKKKWDW